MDLIPESVKNFSYVRQHTDATRAALYVDNAHGPMTTLEATMGLQETQRYQCPGVPSPWILCAALKLCASDCSGAAIRW